MIEHKRFVDVMLECGELMGEDSQVVCHILYDMNEKTWSVFLNGDAVLNMRVSMPLRYRQYLVCDLFLYGTMSELLISETSEVASDGDKPKDL